MGSLQVQIRLFFDYKPEHLSAAQTVFAKTNIQVTACGQHHLRAALGSRQLAKEYVTIKIESWTEEVSTLVEVAASNHTPLTVLFTHGLILPDENHS